MFGPASAAYLRSSSLTAVTRPYQLILKKLIRDNEEADRMNLFESLSL